MALFDAALYDDGLLDDNTAAGINPTSAGLILTLVTPTVAVTGNAPVLVNAAKAEDFSSSITTLSLPATSLTQGNLIVVAFSVIHFFAAAPTGTVSDTAGNTYTLATSTNDGQSGWRALYVYYCANALGHASNVVTVTLNTASTSTSIESAQYQGVFTTSPLDVVNASNGGFTSTTSFTSGSFTTTNANSLILVFSDAAGGTSGNTFTAGSGYTLQQNNRELSLEDRGVGSILTGATASITCNASGTWMMCVAVFKTYGASHVHYPAAATLTLTPTSPTLKLTVRPTATTLTLSAGTPVVAQSSLNPGTATLALTPGSPTLKLTVRPTATSIHCALGTPSLNPAFLRIALVIDMAVASVTSSPSVIPAVVNLGIEMAVETVTATTPFEAVIDLGIEMIVVMELGTVPVSCITAPSTFIATPEDHGNWSY